ncbi:MAG: hypothetical protein KIT14_08480 [bacterium]|nr:hypothetical protein [bacterium]
MSRAAPLRAGRCLPRAGAVAVAAILLARVAAAAVPAEPAAVLDALVAAQAADGGWHFAPEADGRPHGHTWVMRVAEWLAQRLGGPHWDLVVVRSPGTPSAGLALVAGWRATGRAQWLASARRAGDLLIALQLAPGGWVSEMPVERGRLTAWFPWVSPRITLDDDVTPGAVRFLLALWEATGDARYRDAAVRGVDLLAGAQLPSGAWPHVWRPRWMHVVRRSRDDTASLNDGTTPLAIDTLVVAAAALGRPDLLRAARHGGRWLLAVQHGEPRAGWAQQYDAEGRPAPMRVFEPAALATWESRHAVEALETLARATGEPQWCEGARQAARWLADVALAPGCWARLLDPTSGRPLYLAADGTRVPLAAARPGYDWTGDFGIPALLVRFGLAGGPELPIPAPGDPLACPGRPDPFRTHGGARAVAADATLAVAVLAPRPPSPCAPVALVRAEGRR